jgi:protein SCO1/2
MLALVFYVGPVTAESISTDTIEGVATYQQPASLPEFSLTDHQGQPFDVSRLKGKMTVIYFGYLSCPDACPMTMTFMTHAFRRLEQSPALKNQLQFVFVSVDPARDSTSELSEYIQYFNPDFIGVTGQQDQLVRLASSLAIAYEYQDVESGDLIGSDSIASHGGNYYVNHSSELSVLDPDAQLVAHIIPPLTMDQAVNALVELIGRYGSVP